MSTFTLNLNSDWEKVLLLELSLPFSKSFFGSSLSLGFPSNLASELEPPNFPKG